MAAAAQFVVPAQAKQMGRGAAAAAAKPAAPPPPASLPLQPPASADAAPASPSPAAKKAAAMPSTQLLKKAAAAPATPPPPSASSSSSSFSTTASTGLSVAASATTATASVSGGPVAAVPDDRPQTISAPDSVYTPPRTLELATDIDLVKDGKMSVEEAKAKWGVMLYYLDTRKAALGAIESTAQVADTVAAIKRAEAELEAKLRPTTNALADEIRALVISPDSPSLAEPRPVQDAAVIGELESQIEELKRRMDEQMDELDAQYALFKTFAAAQEQLEIDAEIELLKARYRQ